MVNLEKKSAKKPLKKSAKKPLKKSAKKSLKSEPKKKLNNPIKKKLKNPTKKKLKNPTKKKLKNPTKKKLKNPTKKSAKKPLKKSAKKSLKSATKKSLKNPAKKPLKSETKNKITKNTRNSEKKYEYVLYKKYSPNTQIESIFINGFKRINVKIINDNELYLSYLLKCNGNILIKTDSIQEIFSSLIKHISQNNNVKLFFKKIQNMFYGEECFVLCPGRTYNNLSLEHKTNIISNYFTIAVKYVIDDIMSLNLIPSIHIFNKYLNNKMNLYSKCLSISSEGKNNEYKSDLMFKLKGSHGNTFKKINAGEDMLSIENNINKNTKGNNYYFNLGHIMYELVIPFCIHFGFKHIYTCGWDLNYDNGSYYNSDKKIKLKTPTEAHTTKKMSQILKKNFGIIIYKLFKESKPEINYKNINNIFKK
jgi:hypothetical protein